MMRRISLNAVLIFGFLGNAFGSSDSITNYVNELRSTPLRQLDHRAIPSETKDEVFSMLRAANSIPTLIRLRDQKTIENVLSEYRESRGGKPRINQWIRMSASPWMIREMAEFMYEDDEISPRSWSRDMTGWVDWGFSHVTAELIVQIMSEAPEFSASTRQWAKNAFVHRPDFLMDMIQWWEKNAEYFENEDYHLVRPVSGDWENEETPDDEGEERNEEPVPDEPSDQGDAGAGGSLEGIEPEAAGPLEEPSTTQPRSVWLWFAAIVALAVTILRLRAGRKTGMES